VVKSRPSCRPASRWLEWRRGKVQKRLSESFLNAMPLMGLMPGADRADPVVSEDVIQPFTILFLAAAGHWRSRGGSQSSPNNPRVDAVLIGILMF